MKFQKGITLIALIVTILVIIILVGIGITIITSDNGILVKAKLAKEETDKSSQDELEYLNEISDYIDTTTTSRGENGSSNVGKMSNALVSVSYSSDTTTMSASNRTLNSFTKTYDSLAQNYLEWDTTNNCIKIKKSGWYILNSNLRSNVLSGSGSLYTTLVVNQNTLSQTVDWGSTTDTVQASEKTLTVYLEQDDLVNAIFSTAFTGQYYQVYFQMFANF